ncbi:MAG: zinc-dependent metalloprotease [Planctomycetaceae bacterium]|nr:zinc-dependent metalloprotease [Planctomycetaceae bacterium]
MKHLSFTVLLLIAFCVVCLIAQEPTPPATPAATPSAADRDRPRPIKDVLPDARKIEGLINFYQRRDRLVAEIRGNNLNTDYLIAIAVARGSGTTAIGGYTYQSGGSDWLWQFRKVNDTIQVVRRNIRFTADSGTPEARAVEVGFSDSILYSLPIIAIGENGGDVVDLAPIFMADLPRLGIGTFDRSRSTWGDVKGFPNNMEFRVNATYSGARSTFSPDPNSVGVTLHYSISRLPSSGYSPRMADSRIGYFTVSHKNFSRAVEDNHMIRYINRWNIQKADSSAALSPPRKPIVFWIEKTVPFKYRNAVREGILEWNKAFEKVGIVDAIEVRQQADSDTWDAEDINYNTIRWITSERGFAMGPSRVNPLTGEILDADIIIDASWITHWRDRFDNMIADVIPSNTNRNAEHSFFQQRSEPAVPEQDDAEFYESINNRASHHAQERAAHVALAYLALALNGDNGEGNGNGNGNGNGKDEENGDKKEPKENGEEEDKENGKENGTENGRPKTRAELIREREEKFERLVFAAIKDLTTHEVGHTLGLRHNFQASSWLTLDEMNDPDRSKEYGHAGSVMDYLPINIAPKGKPQGDYFMSGLGPYDYLAIEYGYKIIPGGSAGERRELARIAARQAEDGNNYSTDEDLRLQPDPRSGIWDLGKNPLEFSQRGLELYNQLMAEILDRAIREDGQYRDVGRYYRLLVSLRMRENNLLLRNIEGLLRNRDRRGDPGNRPPIQVVDASTKRESVQFLCDHTFGADAFGIAPEIYNQFGEERWGGLEVRPAVSLSAVITAIQCDTLESLLAPWVFTALTDTALRVSESEDVYTIDELFSTVTASIFSELDAIKEGDEFSARNPMIPALRRTLQEHCFKLLASYALGDGISYFFPDANSSRSLARQELVKLESKIHAALNVQANRDAASAAHLTMLHDRVKKLLEVSLLTGRP